MLTNLGNEMETVIVISIARYKQFRWKYENQLKETNSGIEMRKLILHSLEIYTQKTNVKVCS